MNLLKHNAKKGVQFTREEYDLVETVAGFTTRLPHGLNNPVYIKSRELYEALERSLGTKANYDKRKRIYFTSWTGSVVIISKK